MISCPHRPPCSACPRFAEPGIAATASAALDHLARRYGLPQVPLIAGQSVGYRLRARLAIRGRVGSPKLGLFESGSHRVVHIPHCIVQHPVINRVAAVVRRVLAETRVTSYSDAAHLGLARYLQVVVERSSQTAQVVLVANCATPAALGGCLDLIRERLAGELHSLWFNANENRANTILGQRFEQWYGPASVIESFGGARVHYPPGAFGRNNLEMAEAIVEHVRDQVPHGSRVAEFYAGVGAIGLSLLSRAAVLCMNELNPHSLQGLRLGLAELDPQAQAKISVVPGPAGAARLTAAGAQVVIADPPRKGLDPELTDFLMAQPPERFIYISCGLDSFFADAERLTSNGRLRLAALTAFNLMPFTEHVETVARFERA